MILNIYTSLIKKIRLTKKIMSNLLKDAQEKQFPHYKLKESDIIVFLSMIHQSYIHYIKIVHY
jgi:hypothetical protein